MPTYAMVVVVDMTDPDEAHTLLDEAVELDDEGVALVEHVDPIRVTVFDV